MAGFVGMLGSGTTSEQAVCGSARMHGDEQVVGFDFFNVNFR